LSDKLEVGINEFFKGIKGKVDKFIEISFVGNNNFVQISFFEMEKRTELDIEGIKRLHMDQQHSDSKFTMEKVLESEKEKQMKRVEKYVFFDVQDGTKVFEYGGIKGSNPTFPQQGSHLPLQIYDLNLEVKEIREEQFYPQLVFTFAGDFLHPPVKKKEVFFKWAMNVVYISMFDLFNGYDDQESRIAFIHEQYLNAIQGTLQGTGDYYLFDSNLIEQ
jgi:hypothetical protein